MTATQPRQLDMVIGRGLCWRPLRGPVVACLDYYAGAANKSYGQTIPALGAITFARLLEKIRQYVEIGQQ